MAAHLCDRVNELARTRVCAHIPPGLVFFPDRSSARYIKSGKKKYATRPDKQTTAAAGDVGEESPRWQHGWAGVVVWPSRFFISSHIFCSSPVFVFFPRRFSFFRKKFKTAESAVARWPISALAQNVQSLELPTLIIYSNTETYTLTMDVLNVIELVLWIWVYSWYVTRQYRFSMDEATLRE